MYDQIRALLTAKLLAAGTAPTTAADEKKEAGALKPSEVFVDAKQQKVNISTIFERLQTGLEAGDVTSCVMWWCRSAC